MHITEFKIEVKPQLPESIAGLAELAENLLYSWQGSIRELFIALDRGLWTSCHHNPTLFLRRIDESRLASAAEDPEYLEQYKHWQRPTVRYLRGH